MDLPRGFVGYWQPFGAGHIVRTNKKTFSYGTLHFPRKIKCYFSQNPRAFVLAQQKLAEGNLCRVVDDSVCDVVR